MGFHVSPLDVSLVPLTPDSYFLLTSPPPDSPIYDYPPSPLHHTLLPSRPFPLLLNSIFSVCPAQSSASHLTVDFKAPHRHLLLVGYLIIIIHRYFCTQPILIFSFSLQTTFKYLFSGLLPAHCVHKTLHVHIVHHQIQIPVIIWSPSLNHY